MKKLLLILGAVFMIAGCQTSSTGDGMFPGITIGQDGADGVDGTDGLSAYEIAVQNGFEGTETEWLDSLRGEAGVDGIDGLDGLSAYQLWVLAGNEGTEQDFLNSLIGPQGPSGEDGADGVCPDCPDDNATEPTPPEFPEGIIRMTFSTKITGLTNMKIGHLVDGTIVSIEDANITEENNVSYIKYDMNISSEGNHMIGLQFDK